MRSLWKTMAWIATLTFAPMIGAQPAQQPAAPKTATADRGKPALARGDVSFMKKAGEHGLAEVDLGRLGQERAMRDEVKQFANRIVTDHSKANEELMGIAASKGVQLPTAPDKKHQKEREKLAKLSGPDFDRAFMKAMVDDHENDLRDFEKQAKSARDADVKAFAAKHVPVLRDHLREAKVTYDIARLSKRTGERETGSKKP